MDSVNLLLEAAFFCIFALIKVRQFIMSSKAEFDRFGMPSQYLYADCKVSGEKLISLWCMNWRVVGNPMMKRKRIIFYRWISCWCHNISLAWVFNAWTGMLFEIQWWKGSEWYSRGTCCNSFINLICSFCWCS